MEKLIRPSEPAQLSATGGGAMGRVSDGKMSSAVVEVGSLCSMDARRIVRDFGEK